jgi:PilZ domain
MKKPVKSRRNKIGSARFDLNIEVQFLGLTVEGMEVHGAGIVRNLSLRGALIDTDALVEKDDHLTLFLTLPTQTDVLEIPAVAVRWVVRRHQLGVEFLKVDAATSRRLMRFLSGIHIATRVRRTVADQTR